MDTTLAQVTVSVNVPAANGAPTTPAPGTTLVPSIPTAPDGGLPRTGADAVAVLTLLAVVLVALGMAAVRLARGTTRKAPTCAR